MDALKPEIKRELIRRVFPDLRYGGDPDIERYFELRRDRRLAEALDVYNGRLRVRYPDDSARVALLRLYRERDPRYASYQDSLILELGDKLARRIAANIDLIVSHLERAELSDAFTALKAVESVLTRFGGDTEAALTQLARYEEFSRLLNHRSLLCGRALELVREYDAVARADSPADYDFIARSEAIEQRRRAALSSRSGSASSWVREERYDFVAMSAEHELRAKAQARAHSHYFDPAKIKFSAQERGRVEIPDSLRRREDRVLVFCAKYWNQVRDPAFDRLVFLYARKYGTSHYEIFRAVKMGRLRGSSDDEILSEVSGILTTSYSYSVSGDLYMQVMWRRLRSRMEARAIEHRLAAPGPESRVRAAHAERRKTLGPAETESRTRREPEPSAPQEAPTRGFAARAPQFALREASRRAAAQAALRKPTTPPAPAGKPAAQERKRPEGAAEPELRTAVRARLPEPERRSGYPAPSREPSRIVGSPEPQEPERRVAALQADAHSSPRPAVGESGPARARENPTPPELLTPVAKPSGSRLLVRPPAGPEPVPRIEGRGGSISDRIRSLSGKAYDVYREIFLEEVRGHIHRYLLSHQTKSHGLFDTAANEAEDQIFGFMAAHYDDPFMDWDHSAERAVAEGLGFSLPSLDPIVEACFKNL